MYDFEVRENTQEYTFSYVHATVAYAYTHLTFESCCKSPGSSSEHLTQLVKRIIQKPHPCTSLLIFINKIRLHESSTALFYHTWFVKVLTKPEKRSLSGRGTLRPLFRRRLVEEIRFPVFSMTSHFPCSNTFRIGEGDVTYSNYSEMLSLHLCTYSDPLCMS